MRKFLVKYNINECLKHWYESSQPNSDNPCEADIFKSKQPVSLSWVNQKAYVLVNESKDSYNFIKEQEKSYYFYLKSWIFTIFFVLFKYLR